MARRLLPFWLSSIAALSGAVACSHCSSSSSPATGNDADGGKPKPDAGVVFSDSGVVDAGPLGSDWPGWQKVAGLDSSCIVDRAVNPVTALPAITWIPCTNGMAGCTEIKTGWRTDGINDNFTAIYVSKGSSSRLFQPTFRLSETLFECDLYDLSTFEPLLGWRDQTTASCAVLPTLGVKNVVAVAEQPNLPTLYASGSPAVIGAGPNFISFPSALASLENTGEGVQDTSASDTTFATDLVPAGIIVRTPLSSNSFVRTYYARALIYPLVQDDDVFAWDQHGADGWALETVVGSDGTVATMRAVSQRHIMLFDTDGSSLVWVEAYGGEASSYSQPTVEVWAAPYTNSPSTLQATARKVATIPTASQVGLHVAFDGLYAVSAGDGANSWVVRLSDGAIQTVSAGTGRAFDWLAYVTTNDLWSAMTPAGSGGEVAFARIALGAW